MFKLTGDVIEFDGWTVGTLLNDMPATVRAQVDEALKGDELEELRAELEELDKPCEDCKNFEEEREDLESKCQEAIEQRDAYAAILGVTP